MGFDQYQQIRLKKLEAWSERQLAYPGKFDKNADCISFKTIEDDTKNIKCAGRLILMRTMGKLTFAHIQDDSGKAQICFQQDILGVEEYKFLIKNLDIGDHIGIEGRMFTTKKLEKTLSVEKAILLSKSIRSLPEKFHGLQDPELRARYRYLDLIMNEETKNKFKIRNSIIRYIRKYLENHKFFEVETPILQNAACGASARPFITHHNALDIPLYMRIAPETYLKRLVAGGYERVFEIGRCFRNEGIDASHLQEFTMLEWYAAYWDFKDNMPFVQQLIKGMIQDVLGTLEIEYEGIKIDFAKEWDVISYRDLVHKYTNIDLNNIDSFEDLKKEVQKKGLDLPLDKYIGLGGLIDGLYKKYCRPNLIQPTFVTMHHSELVPLARRSDFNSKELDMFQIVVNGWEVVKAYSELVDPVEQRNRLLEQKKLASEGDEEAMMLEEDFLIAMEYGMPPMSGLGMGIERMVALLTNSPNIRDIIYFPSLRPPKGDEENF